MPAADLCGGIYGYNADIQKFIAKEVTRLMKKQTMIVSLAALALLVSPLGNMGGLFRVSAEEQQGAELYSVSGSEQETGTMAFAPMVQFYDNYFGGYRVENTTDSNISYAAEMVLKKDGGTLWSGSVFYGFSSCPLAQYMEETGSYQLQVRVWSNVKHSEWGSSPVVKYTRPERALGTTVGHWDEEQKGLLHYPAVEGAAGYQWRC